MPQRFAWCNNATLPAQGGRARCNNATLPVKELTQALALALVSTNWLNLALLIRNYTRLLSSDKPKSKKLARLTAYFLS